MKPRRVWIAGTAAMLCVVAGSLRPLGGGTVLSVRFGGTVWIPIHASDPWLPKPIAIALSPRAPVPEPGALRWRTLAAGFEAGDLSVIAGKTPVDRILLARIDPAQFRFAVRNAPRGDKELDDWMAERCPALVVNGSYYGRDGLPATPVLSDGRPLGPQTYSANQGAFVSSAEATGLQDLLNQDWHALFKGADAAMVSYPLLLAQDGTSRAAGGSGWLANRSFLGQDREGRILIGTSEGAYFTLDRLAAFLKTAPLDLKLALNLDGGPVACQGISLGGFERRQCGKWEIQVKDGHVKLIPTWQLLPMHFGTPAMPMALLVYPRSEKAARDACASRARHFL
jgi:Phosphodiester glycosidase